MENLELVIGMTNIDPKLNTNIKKYIYAKKHKWKKDLNNVKALTSGFNPRYNFFNELYDFSYKILKKIPKKNGKNLVGGLVIIINLIIVYPIVMSQKYYHQFLL